MICISWKAARKQLWAGSCWAVLGQPLGGCRWQFGADLQLNNSGRWETISNLDAGKCSGMQENRIQPAYDEIQTDHSSLESKITTLSPRLWKGKSVALFEIQNHQNFCIANPKSSIYGKR